MLFILVKASLISTHASHFAGGKHAFCCMADTLTAMGHQVHVVCASTKAQLLVAAMQGGHAAPDLASITSAAYGHTSGPHVVQWAHRVPQALCEQLQASVRQQGVPLEALHAQPGQCVSVSFHAVLKDSTAAAAAQTAQETDSQVGCSWQAGLACHVQQLAQQAPDSADDRVVVIIDADDSQLQPTAVEQSSGGVPQEAVDEGAGVSGAAGVGEPAGSSTPLCPVICSTCRCQADALHQGQQACVTDIPQHLVQTAPMQQQDGGQVTECNMQQAAAGSARSLFEQVVSAAQLCSATVVTLVQNVHFLPFGPSGTSARTPGLLQAWSCLQGVLCVSQFVHDYVIQHLHVSCNTTVTASAAACQAIVHVTKLNAWGCFGLGPFEDLTEQAAGRLEACQSKQHQQQSMATVKKKPVIGVLKLTPEKGCSIIHQLALRTAGQYNWLLVSGDPAVHSLFQGMSNVKVIDPQPDVGTVLRAVCCVLVPSLWLEAWGMVVIDSLLRGIPVLVSDTGALHEAGLGVCPAVPVEPLVVPPCGVCGTPTWAARQYPRQQVQPWEQAIQQLLHDPAAFRQLSHSCREAATVFVQQQPQQLQSFFMWLNTLSQKAQPPLQA